MKSTQKLKDEFAKDVSGSLEQILNQQHRFNGNFSEEFEKLSNLRKLTTQKHWRVEEMKSKKGKALNALRGIAYKTPHDDLAKLAKSTYWHLKGVFDFEGIWGDIFYSRNGRLSLSVKMGVYDENQ